MTVNDMIESEIERRKPELLKYYEQYIKDMGWNKVTCPDNFNDFAEFIIMVDEGLVE